MTWNKATPYQQELDVTLVYANLDLAYINSSTTGEHNASC